MKISTNSLSVTRPYLKALSFVHYFILTCGKLKWIDSINENNSADLRDRQSQNNEKATDLHGVCETSNYFLTA